MLQRQLRNLRRTGTEVLAGRLRNERLARERALRTKHLQFRPSLLQRELRYLRRAGSNLRPAGLRRRDSISDEPSLRHEHLQHGQRVLQPELRDLRCSRRAVLTDRVLSARRISPQA